jgi:hypothetical protein
VIASLSLAQPGAAPAREARIPGARAGDIV